MTKQNKVKNGLCVDVEGYTDIRDDLPIHRHLLSSNAEKVHKNNVQILDILDRTNTKGTFFIITSYVEEVPEIATEVEKRGHEIGIHGYDHKLASKMDREEFADAIDRSLEILKKHTSSEILGYQAPDFSVTRDNFWVFDVLMEKGLKYDCSVFPVRHPNYGIEDFSREPVTMGGSLLEVPMPTLRVLGRNIPFGGGGYLRHLPYALTRQFYRLFNRSGRNALTYVHPWEFENTEDWLHVFELDQIHWVSKWRYFGGCGEKFAAKFERLMGDFTFVPVKELYEEIKREENRPQD